MNDSTFELKNATLNKGVLEELTSHEMEAITGGVRDSKLPMACFAKCQRQAKQALRN